MEGGTVSWNLFLALFGLTSLGAASMYWVMGAFGGFRLWSKLPERFRKVVKCLRYLSILSLCGGGLMAGIALTRSCGFPSGGVSLSAVEIPQMRLWRPLGKLDISGHPFKELQEAKAKAEAKTKAEAAKRAKQEAREAKKQAMLQARMGQIQWMSGATASGTMVMMGSGSFTTTTTATAVSMSGNMIVTCSATTGDCTMQSVSNTDLSNDDYMKMMGAHEAQRKGPFCRVTCSFHHSDNLATHKGDVEVDGRYCNENTIKKDVVDVMGWERLPPPNEKYEVGKPWPGPAQGGLDWYKLYWDKLDAQTAKAGGGSK
jgi:hypothetical protein